MPLEPMSSIKCFRRRAYSLEFTEPRDLCASVYFARCRGPYGTELLERELHAHAHVLAHFREGKIRLAVAGRFVLAHTGAADLDEIAQDLRERIAFGRAGDH